MVKGNLFEIAIFVFIMLSIGIGLTIYEFKKMINEDEKIKKKSRMKSSR